MKKKCTETEKEEIAITSFEQLKKCKAGSLFIIKQKGPLEDLFGTEPICVYSNKLLIDKYCIIINGKKCRSLGYSEKNKKLERISAEEENCKGDEKIYQFDFFIHPTGTLTINETYDINQYKLYKINKNHPNYNKDLSKFGLNYNVSINKMFKILNLK